MVVISSTPEPRRRAANWRGRRNQAQELLTTQGRRAMKRGRVSGDEDLSQTSHVIVVPVGGDHPDDGRSRHAHTLQVLERNRAPPL
jgi:hypothetical protein